jgi:predicted DNA-binding transcriptional regulator YafY
MRADRLLSIMLILQARGRVTMAALASELDVSRRTVLRDIEALSIAGVPVYAEGGHGGGVSLDEGYRTSLTGLKEPEVRALFLGGAGALLRQIGLGDAASSVRQKLAGALPAAHQDAINHLRQRIYIDPLYWWHESEAQPFWEQLQAAVHTDRRIHVRYESYEGATTERDLDAYGLVAKSGAWYLVAKDDSAFKSFRVSRIHALDVFAQHFARDPGFDLERHWTTHLDAFKREFAAYEFTLRVHPDRQTYMRSMMPGRARVIATDPHSGWLTYACQVSNIEHALMITFALFEQGEIIAPEELRVALRATCARQQARL